MENNNQGLPQQPNLGEGAGPEAIHDEFTYASSQPEKERIIDPGIAQGPREKQRNRDPKNAKGKNRLAQKKSDEIDILKYLSVLLRRKKLIGVTMLAFIFLSLVKDLGIIDMYKSETKLLVQLQKQNPIGQFDPGYFWDRQTKINTMLNTITSREVMQRVLDSMNLHMSVSALTSAINISRVNETNLIVVSATSPDPNKAAQIANCVARQFIGYNNEINRKDISDAIMYIENQTKKTSAELKEKEETLKLYQEVNKFVEISSDNDMQVQKLSSMELSLQTTIVEMVENDVKLNQLERLLKKEKVYVEESFTFDNTLEAKLIQLNVELAKARADVGEQHTRVKLLKENIRQIQEMLKKNAESNQKISSTKSLNQTRLNMLQEYNTRKVENYSLIAKKQAYERVIEELDKSISQIPDMQLKYMRLKRDKENIEKIYGLLQEKYQEQRIRYEMQSSDIVQWEEATIPKGPLPHGQRFGFLILVFVGLVVGSALAFLIEQLDQSIKTPQEMEDELQLPLLGIIPLLDEETKTITIDSKSGILEPYRSLRTNIRYTDVGTGKRSILITSAIQGDGKTTKVCNLAISFAMENKKVMIIDADLRRSNVHKIFNIEREKGLSEYLTGQASLAEIGKKLYDDRIIVVPAGKRPPNPAELLGNGRIKDLIDEAFTFVDVVIIDSPAIVPVSDALLLTPHVDSTILVGRALKTPMKAMHYTKDSLERSGANIIGIIFNGMAQRKGYYPYYYSYYSYYHYYKSKYYYEEDNQQEKLPKNFQEFLVFAVKETFIELKSKTHRFLRSIKLLRERLKISRRHIIFAFALVVAILLAIMFGKYLYIKYVSGDSFLPGNFRYEKQR
ncbi:MAG: hypothetical protein A2268_09615 [Candidatus Raymondbacteria bacterium RifOxyA12_full_50_37]|uniref:non-specific protein-tyrosine kinase n=1 Tax=Candidatus Raymondbacteria bacterium RIFOXYD12_FULL_49_13 TaxID=1817890 RepID=A0A1F7F1F7_UNCRA|nr:MAG: hypothetical protein A2268_09615 [Candidatus Raymondbacteria bacterium RifOxyA12_full_50_37]OGJ93145.1 MAG: hypothetical protein A2350_17810 [Candidatus Raymondbacteria bacterium RifOxyB12_full_50_8]OGJ93903.1 MAG: hypothetical protein A2248_06680 [Candidatus Raymondbacteria bacterium RIFOXYA2_FULL_49_16]OGJ98228.1 MAG: hypothetical protein A2453_00485 [Candidatus Raymondbacteria bacterium RIFOXYC2_FULL_50_21]OGK00461.1 MAG: hypothetical protein A2519_10660 [Candidatus Raymondbacteria b